MIAGLRAGDSVLRVGVTTDLLDRGQEYTVSHVNPSGWRDCISLREVPDVIFSDSGFTLASRTSENLAPGLVPAVDDEEGWWTTNFTGAVHGLTDSYLEQMGLEYRVQLRRKR